MITACGLEPDTSFTSAESKFENIMQGSLWDEATFLPWGVQHTIISITCIGNQQTTMSSAASGLSWLRWLQGDHFACASTLLLNTKQLVDMWPFYGNICENDSLPRSLHALTMVT